MSTGFVSGTSGDLDRWIPTPNEPPQLVAILDLALAVGGTFEGLCFGALGTGWDGGFWRIICHLGSSQALKK